MNLEEKYINTIFKWILKKINTYGVAYTMYKNIATKFKKAGFKVKKSFIAWEISK